MEFPLLATLKPPITKKLIEVHLRIQPDGELEIYPGLEVSFQGDGSCSLHDVLTFFCINDILDKRFPVYVWDEANKSYLYCSDMYNNKNIWIPKTSIFSVDGKTVVYMKYKNIALLEFRAQQKKNGHKFLPFGNQITRENKFSEEDDLNLIPKSFSNQIMEGSEKGLPSEIKIYEIINLIKLWKKYCNGFMCLETKKYIKMKPEEAAKKMQIDIHILENYDSYLVKAIRYGFDIAEHSNESFEEIYKFTHGRVAEKMD